MRIPRPGIGSLFSAFVPFAGLVIAFCAVFLCAAFVANEFSYDRSIPDGEDTYRVNLTINPPGSEPVHLPSQTAATAAVLRNNIASIGMTTRLSDEDVVLNIRGQRTRQEAYVVDPDFLDFFGIELEAGHPHSALSQPDSAVISRGLADRLLGSANPLGAELEVGDGELLKVTGILAGASEPSHMAPKFLISSRTPFTRLAQADAAGISGDFFAHTYVKLRPGSVRTDVETQLNDAIRSTPVMPPPQAEALGPNLDLIRVRDIHLHGLSVGELTPGGNLMLVISIASVGLLILAVTSLNYSMIAAADGDRRIREIGVRRAFGATSLDILLGLSIRHFVRASAAMLMGALLLWATKDMVEELVGLHLSMMQPASFLTLVVIPLCTVAVAAFALALSSSSALAASPAAALGGELARKGMKWRQAAAALQFSVSMGLIAMTLVMAGQTSLAMTGTLDIGDDDILIVDGLQAPFPANGQQELAASMRDIPGVRATSLSEIVPSDFSTSMVGLSNPAKGKPDPAGFAADPVSSGFFSTYGLQPLAGEVFRPNTASSRVNELVLTKTASARLGFESPRAAVGKSVSMTGPDGLVPFSVVGVVPDIPLKSIALPAEPIVFAHLGQHARFLSIRYSPDVKTAVHSALERNWQRFSTEPLRSSSLRDRLAEIYSPLTHTYRFFLGLSGIALGIVALGVFGTVALTAERRAKEMGLRKAFGASFRNVIAEMASTVTTPMLLASLFAVPLSVWAASWWLAGFNQRIPLSPAPFIVGVAVSAFVGIVAMSFQTARLARARPADLLRREA